MQKNLKQYHFVFWGFFPKQLETSVFWATVNTDIPPLSFLKIYILLWWDIFFRPWRAPLPLRCAETAMLSCVLRGEEKKQNNTHRDPAEDRMTVGCWRTARCHVNTYNLQSAVRLLINSFPCSYRVDTFIACQLVLWSLAEVITRQTAKELFDAVFL